MPLRGLNFSSVFGLPFAPRILARTPIPGLKRALIQNQAALSSQPQAIELAVVFNHNFFSALGKLVETDFAGALIWPGRGRIGIRWLILSDCHESVPRGAMVETASQQRLPLFKKLTSVQDKQLAAAERNTTILRLNLSVNTPQPKPARLLHCTASHARGQPPSC